MRLVKQLWIAGAVVFCWGTAPVAAQQCVGLPAAGRALATYGFEGTDGATGESFGLALLQGRTTLLLQRRRLEMFMLAGDVTATEGQISTRLGDGPLCAVLGLSRTAYDVDWVESTQFVTERGGTRYEIDRRRVEGPYQRIRLPVGIAVGRQFAPTRWLAVSSFVNPALVMDWERFDRVNAPAEMRTAVGLAGSAGVTLGVSRVVLRSTVSHAFTTDELLSGQTNGPALSVQLGLLF